MMLLLSVVVWVFRLLCVLVLSVVLGMKLLIRKLLWLLVMLLRWW